MKTYLQSWAEFGGEGPPPVLLGRRPRHDEVEGIDLFRTQLTGVALERVTLPHLFACRSLLSRSSFVSADLHQSVITWCDVEHVDFSSADLRESDLRNSQFVAARFENARLEQCDLRGSSFDGCDFSGARLDGAIVTREQLGALSLSVVQRQSLKVDTADDAPGG